MGRIEWGVVNELVTGAAASCRLYARNSGVTSDDDELTCTRDESLYCVF